jgi:hypothetical protein
MAVNNISDNPIATEIPAWVTKPLAEIISQAKRVDNNFLYAYSVQNDTLHYIYSNENTATMITFLDAQPSPLIK